MDVCAAKLLERRGRLQTLKSLGYLETNSDASKTRMNEYTHQGLLRIEQDRGFWNLFWAPSTVRSEKWEVRTADGLPTQIRPLCRVVTSR
jgi:hypothetical protein